MQGESRRARFDSPPHRNRNPGDGALPRVVGSGCAVPERLHVVRERLVRLHTHGPGFDRRVSLEPRGYCWTRIDVLACSADRFIRGHAAQALWTSPCARGRRDDRNGLRFDFRDGLIARDDVCAAHAHGAGQSAIRSVDSRRHRPAFLHGGPRWLLGQPRPSPRSER